MVGMELSTVIFSLIIGTSFGILLQKGRFCFTMAMRDYIAYKDTRVLRGVTTGILTAMIGISIAYTLGVSENNFWVPNFGLSNVIGGFIFGIGMVYGGGCASGTLYRAGEGYIYYWVMLIFVALGYAAFALLFPAVFLPYYFEPLQIFSGFSLIKWLGNYSIVMSLLIIISTYLILKNNYKISIKEYAKININSITVKKMKGPWDTAYVGIGLGIMATLWFALWGSWSVTGPEAKWFGLGYSKIFGEQFIENNIYWKNVVYSSSSISITPDMVMLISLVFGSFLAAYFSGEFKIRKMKTDRLPNAVIGGILMGFGSRMAPGCNISNTFTGLAFLSVPGFVTSLGLLLGVYVATHWMFRKVGCAI